MEYRKTIGVLGGMGPAATVDFFGKLVKAADAGSDQDHPRIVIDCNPKIPDRTAAILKNGVDPLPAMLESLSFLEMVPVDFVVIPCVTAHFFHASLSERASVPILHIVEETVGAIVEKFPHVTKVGAVATSGTIKSGLIADICRNHGIDFLAPAESIQESKVMEAIYRIKAVGPNEAAKRLVKEAAETLVCHGAQAVIAGCTEIPLVLADGDLAVPVLDPMAILAKRALIEAQ